MKRTTFLSVPIALLVASTAFGLDQPKFGNDTASAPAASTTPAAASGQSQQMLVKVAHLPTPEVNREFQANVQLVQAQRQAAVELNTAMDKEKDPKKKAELKKQFDELMAKLTDNNEKMVKAYGFSLNRNYVLEVESANVYVVATPEEAAQIEKQQKAANAPAKK